MKSRFELDDKATATLSGLALQFGCSRSDALVRSLAVMRVLAALSNQEKGIQLVLTDSLILNVNVYKAENPLQDTQTSELVHSTF